MSEWNLESVLATLGANDLVVKTQKEIDHATQVILRGGTALNVYNSGKVVVGGKRGAEREQAEKLFPSEPGDQAAAMANASPQPPSKVFIVHGHNTDCREQLELLLLRFKLTPIVLANEAPSGKTIIEALEDHSDADFAFVLLTGDDEGHRAGHPDELRPRARQNVVLEMGMFLMKLGRSKVGILHKGDIELPSDISGLLYIPFTDDVREAKNQIAGSLQKAGFHIDIENLSAR